MERKKLKPKTGRARRLRAESTDAERKLWAALAARRAGGAKFRRQVPIDRYFADFACIKARLVVELDGGQHVEQEDYDARRSERLAACGWRVVRFWNSDVMENLGGVVVPRRSAARAPPSPDGRGGLSATLEDVCLPRRFRGEERVWGTCPLPQKIKGPPRWLATAPPSS